MNSLLFTFLLLFNFWDHVDAGPKTINPIIVTKTVDTNDGKCDVDCSLREAVLEANANPGLDTIQITTGLYPLSLTGSQEDQAFSGDLDITDTLILKGTTAGSTIIDGANIDRVFDILTTITFTPTVEISNLTIKNGQAPKGPGADFEYPGGGLRNSANLKINEAEIISNTGGSGGGIFNTGTLTITNSLIKANSSEIGASGGGIFSSGILTINSSTISENKALYGGGIYNTGTFHIFSSKVLVNYNGGITNGGDGSIDRTIVSGNTEDSGVLNFSFGKGLLINSSTISNNTGTATDYIPYRGGGITQRGGPLIIKNSTISGNQSNRSGGGLCVEAGSVTLNNVTITKNVADSDGDGQGDGGGFFALSQGITLGNSILADNIDLSAVGKSIPDCSAFLNSKRYILIESLVGCTLAQNDSTVLSNVNPQLGPLQDNGGETPTHSLLTGSPAIDSGNPFLPGSRDWTCEVIDQRGFFRPGGTVCDIGAFEVNPVNHWLFPLIFKIGE